MGAAELGYSGFFRDMFGAYTGVSTMLWRIFTFYLPILVGMGFMLTLKNKGIEAPDKVDMDKMEQAISKEIGGDQ